MTDAQAFKAIIALVDSAIERHQKIRAEAQRGYLTSSGWTLRPDGLWSTAGILCAAPDRAEQHQRRRDRDKR